MDVCSLVDLQVHSGFIIKANTSGILKRDDRHHGEVQVEWIEGPAKGCRGPVPIEFLVQQRFRHPQKVVLKQLWNKEGADVANSKELRVSDGATNSVKIHGSQALRLTKGNIR